MHSFIHNESVFSIQSNMSQRGEREEEEGEEDGAQERGMRIP